MPTLVILGIALAALGLLLTNAALVAWLCIRSKNKGWLRRAHVFASDQRRFRMHAADARGASLQFPTLPPHSSGG